MRAHEQRRPPAGRSRCRAARPASAAARNNRPIRNRRSRPAKDRPECVRPFSRMARHGSDRRHVVAGRPVRLVETAATGWRGSMRSPLAVSTLLGREIARHDTQVHWRQARPGTPRCARASSSGPAVRRCSRCACGRRRRHGRSAPASPLSFSTPIWSKRSSAKRSIRTHGMLLVGEIVDGARCGEPDGARMTPSTRR